MKIPNLLSTLALAATVATPLLISNTAQASDRCENAYDRHVYKHGYRDGYRDSRHERKHRRYERRRHHDDHYYYRPYRAHGHRHSGIDLIFRF